MRRGKGEFRNQGANFPLLPPPGPSEKTFWRRISPNREFFPPFFFFPLSPLLSCRRQRKEKRVWRAIFASFNPQGLSRNIPPPLSSPFSLSFFFFAGPVSKARSLSLRQAPRSPPFSIERFKTVALKPPLFSFSFPLFFPLFFIRDKKCANLLSREFWGARSFVACPLPSHLGIALRRISPSVG